MESFQNESQENKPLAYPECPAVEHVFDNEECICHSLWLEECAIKADEEWLSYEGTPWD